MNIKESFDAIRRYFARTLIYIDEDGSEKKLKMKYLRPLQREGLRRYLERNPKAEIIKVDYKGNINCEDCDSCYGCADCKNCKNCFCCVACKECERCYECISCRSCSDSYGCLNCAKCYLCSTCIGCNDCEDVKNIITQTIEK